MLNKTLSLFSWNVRGLGQSCRCDDVLAELISSRPTFACLQETKLAQVTPAKRKTFLPVRMSSFAAHPSAGAAGGILTAWDANICTVTGTLERPYSLTVFVTLAADGTTLHLTNIYAPTVSAEKSVFLAELAEIAGHVTGPWIIIGDFNLTRSPEDKNSDAFNFTEAELFNSLINELALLELPLVDRAYTWSNHWDNPTLVRLDRCFVNTDWDAAFPNNTLSSRARFASDHVPLLVSASTRIPRSTCFLFENAWLQHLAFATLMATTLDRRVHTTDGRAFTHLLKL